MIRCHLSKLLGEKKLSIADISRDTGINRGVLTRLFHETAIRVDLEAVEQICEYLSCDLSDLFSIEKEAVLDDLKD